MQRSFNMDDRLQKFDDPDSDKSLRTHWLKSDNYEVHHVIRELPRAAQSSVWRNASIHLEQQHCYHDLQEWTSVAFGSSGSFAQGDGQAVSDLPFTRFLSWILCACRN